MNLIAISSAGWLSNQATARSLIQEILQTTSQSMTTIDLHALKLHTGRATADCDAHDINLSEWFKTGTDGYVVDQLAVHATAHLLDPRKPIILDGTGFSAASLQDALITARHAWFSLEEWHVAFVLICNDGVLLDASRVLSNNFYVQPAVLSPLEVTRMTKRLLRLAFVARWFGLRSSRVYGKSDTMLENWLNRRETKQMRLAEKWSHK